MGARLLRSEGANVELRPDVELVVGRDPGCALRLDDTGVSKRHCRMLHDGGWYVEDLDSQNGTFVNGAPARGRTRLWDGDIVRLGPEARPLLLATFRDEASKRPGGGPGPRGSAVDLDDLRRQLEEALRRAADAEARLAGVTKERDQARNDLQAASKRVAELEKINDHLRKQIEESAQKLMNAEVDLIDQRKKIEIIEKINKRLTRELEEMTRERDDRKRERDELEKVRQTLLARANANDGLVHELRKVIEGEQRIIENHERELAGLKATIEDREATIADLRKVVGAR